MEDPTHENDTKVSVGLADVSGEVSKPSIVEAILFSSDKPVTAGRIAQIVGGVDARQVREFVDELNERYEAHGASFRIESIAKGYRLLTLPIYDHWLGQLAKARRETRLTEASMETLAVIAYKQPVMRAEIESVRGVAVGDVLVRLRDMDLIKIVGRAEVIGRPMLYGTTKRFLESFGLESLKELPKVEALPNPEPPLKIRPAPEDASSEPGDDG